MDATPQEERQGDPAKEVFISTIRYYPVGAIQCAVCGKPGETVRLSSSPAGEILVTVMCRGCAQGEAEGLVERGEMVTQGPMLVNVHYIAAINEAARAASENADEPSEKVSESLEGGEPPYQGADLGDEDSDDE